jgi:hypothetical protein
MVAEVIVDPGQMMVHPSQQFYAGDDWLIEATCRNPDGSAMDLSTATLTWRLADIDGLPITTKDSPDNGIEIIPPAAGDPPNGKAFIRVPSYETVLFASDFYLDELTVTTQAGLVVTQWQGRIDVLLKLEALAPVVAPGSIRSIPGQSGLVREGTPDDVRLAPRDVPVFVHGVHRHADRRLRGAGGMRGREAPRGPAPAYDEVGPAGDVLLPSERS